ncbi:MAG: hypothetical protein ACLTGB_04615 [Blautia caecimuris]|jgi:hypothetical protein|nr:hypothetical protein [Blautia sp.]
MGEKIMKSGRNKEKIIELISNFPVIPGHRDSGCGLKKGLCGIR